MKKTIVIANFPRFSNQIWLPTLWTSAKTYYERNGHRTAEWSWYPCDLDLYSEDYFEKITETLIQLKPAVFAISLYVWNYKLSHRVAEWVKTNIPNCLVISGGPHQYFKHDINWFKDKWYIDASLPGDSYGEICFQEILDNYNNGQVDWDLVTDIRYPSTKNRHISVSKKAMTRGDKKYYDYDYAPYAEQLKYIEDFVEKQNQLFPEATILALLETTRGCPYGCTYCDWGGGTSTTVIKRSLENIKRDIDALKTIYLDFLYIGDANFGIFEERDIAIIEHLIDRPFWSKQRFKIGYGGFAKTENRLDTIKRIVELDVGAGLSQQKEIKISMQTLDAEVLKNIDRKNIPLDKQLAALEPIAKNNKLPMYVEIILGLPGMTLEKFYTDLDILGNQRLSLQFFEWILLPETPAYAREYREQFGIKAVDKLNGWTDFELHSQATIVIETKSFSSDDYLQMLLSASLYRLLIQGGFLKKTVEDILHKDISVGQLIRTIIEEFYYKHTSDLASSVKESWDKIIQNPELTCQVQVGNSLVYIGWYFVALAFYEPDKFTGALIKFLQHRYNVPDYVVEHDIKIGINYKNFNKKFFVFPYLYNFTKGNDTRNDFDYLLSLFQHFTDSGKIFAGRKKLLALM
jgi:radical SAM superfamily enzyme YgiQ (UPF0313 family)